MAENVSVIRLVGELATRMVLLGHTLDEAAKSLGISVERAEEIQRTGRYRARQTEILKRLEDSSNAAIADYAAHVKTILMPIALRKLEEALEEDGITPMTLRAVELVLDRGGLPKVTNIQQDVRVRLDDDTLNRIHELESRVTTKVATIDAEWAFALERPAMRQLEKPEDQFAKVEETEITLAPNP